MDAFAVVFAIAILVEALIQVIKTWVPEGAATPTWLWPVIGAVLGVLVCSLAGVDAFSMLGVPLLVPYVGSVLTGVLVSRGASFVHDVWDRLNAA